MSGRRKLAETLEDLMRLSGCCETCDGCFDCDCPKNYERGPKKLQVDMAQIDYEFNLASAD